MKLIAALVLCLSCLSPRPSRGAALDAAVSKPIAAADIVKAISLYNAAFAPLRPVGEMLVSSQISVMTADGERVIKTSLGDLPVEKTVLPEAIPALVEQGREIKISNSHALHNQAGKAFMVHSSLPTSVRSLDQLRQWAEDARKDPYVAGFGELLDQASARAQK